MHAARRAVAADPPTCQWGPNLQVHRVIAPSERGPGGYSMITYMLPNLQLCCVRQTVPTSTHWQRSEELRLACYKTRPDRTQHPQCGAASVWRASCNNTVKLRRRQWCEAQAADVNVKVAVRGVWSDAKTALGMPRGLDAVTVSWDGRAPIARTVMAMAGTGGGEEEAAAALPPVAATAAPAVAETAPADAGAGAAAGGTAVAGVKKM